MSPKTTEDTTEITKEIVDDKTIPTLNKNGKPRKELTEEQKKVRAENLRKGRETAHKMRREMEQQRKEAGGTNKVELKVGKQCCEEDQIKILAKKTKPKKKQVVRVIEESESSSSEEEVIVRRKKKPSKKVVEEQAPAPAPPVVDALGQYNLYHQPQPQPPQPQPPPPPQPNKEEVEARRQEQIRRIKEQKKRDSVMSSIFG